MNKEQTDMRKILLEQADGFNGGWGERPSFQVVGYVDFEFLDTVKEWVENTPDGFTVRRYTVLKDVSMELMVETL